MWNMVQISSYTQPLADKTFQQYLSQLPNLHNVTLPNRPSTCRRFNMTINNSLNQVSQLEAGNDKLQSFLDVISEGQLLHGIPIAVKRFFRVLRRFEPTFRGPKITRFICQLSKRDFSIFMLCFSLHPLPMIPLLHGEGSLVVPSSHLDL